VHYQGTPLADWRPSGKGALTIKSSNPFLWRAANAAWEAGCIDRFYQLDAAHLALIVAVHETRQAMDGVAMEKRDPEISIK